jgi:3'-phosphoadenosine 5'-phosphosulfate sulfotransferase (PAPS reductase)/FAD synthetase
MNGRTDELLLFKRHPFRNNFINLGQKHGSNRVTRCGRAACGHKKEHQQFSRGGCWPCIIDVDERNDAVSCDLQSKTNKRRQKAGQYSVSKGRSPQERPSPHRQGL